jgi:hypothetical protein
MPDSHSNSIHIIYVCVYIYIYIYIYMFTGVRILLIIFLDVVSSQPILTVCAPPSCLVQMVLYHKISFADYLY